MLIAATVAGLGGCGTAPPVADEESDWERQREEQIARGAEVAPPSFPREQDLIPFYVSAVSRFQFFVDGSSIEPGPDGVVRYVLVAISRQGARTVNFEGIRCASAEYRIYATGTDDRRWIRQPSPWRPIRQGNEADRWHEALAIEYFCPLGNPIHSGAEGASALRRGVSRQRQLLEDQR